MARAAIGLGGNVGDVPATLRQAAIALADLGRIEAVSSLYRTRPWGRTHQPHFWNAVLLLQTQQEPVVLLAGLKAIEGRLGRKPSLLWGPRRIDLDILTYGDARISAPGLEIPHPRLFERAFALAPLAEVDARFRPFFEALLASERESVVLAGPFRLLGETQGLMSEVFPSARLAERIRALAAAFVLTDLVTLRIEDANADAIELRKAFGRPGAGVSGVAETGVAEVEPAVDLEPVKADLVGIFHFSRPLPFEGQTATADRELAYVEALGIRNPVRSLGSGRIASIKVRDGQPVEYGQVLFEMDRS